MSLSKYKRLCLVLFLPFLLAGHLLFQIVMKDHDVNAILCQPGITGLGHDCKYLGSREDPLHQYTKKKYDDWFSVYTPKTANNSTPYTVASATRQIIPKAKVVDVSPYYGDARSQQAIMRDLVGRVATVILGVSDPRSSITRDEVLLACNELTYLETPDRYQAICHGEGWSGPLTFEVSGDGASTLNNLRVQIDVEADDLHRAYRIDQLIAYPFFIYFFLALSAAILAVNRAIKYVKNG
jgi:hypothetical protein